MKKYLSLNNEVLSEYEAKGTINREKDLEATRNFFFEDINRNTMFFHDLEEKLSYLVREGYYEPEFLEMYDFTFIKSLFKYAYDQNFRFPSFMSASKFYDSYAMKSRDGKDILERYEDRLCIISLYLAQGNENDAMDFLKYMLTSYQPATPTALNSGKKARGELVSCFKIEMSDSMNSIAHRLGNALELSRLGGGVGVNITDLRPLGDPIKGIENRASGVIPVCKLLENSFSYSNQLGQRGGSGVVYLNVFHADIEDFLSSKRANADEKVRLATLSTGVILPDIFFSLLQQDKEMALFSPYDILKEYGKTMSEISMTEMYYELLENPNIRVIKRLNTRQLYTEIKKVQFESGYPFEMFDDNVNKVHALENVGRVSMSNLCSEILQAQTASNITDYDQENEYGMDVSCNLGSIDIHNSVKEESFGDLIESAMKMLTSVSTLSQIKNVPSVMNGNNKMHSVGLGLMNLNGHLAANEIMYGSDESIEFVDAYFTAFNYYSIKASVKTAKEKKETFFGFEGSKYASGEYFKQYTEKEIEIKSEKVKKAMGNVPVITKQQWAELAEEVKEHGMFHSYRNCVAPTGSISYIRNSTASISPITERVEVRDYANSRTIYPAPFMTNENQHYYTEAYDMDLYKMIDLYATAQKHIDQGISMTLYIKDTWDTEQLAKLYIYAWLKGIKTVYYVRQRLQTLDECASCVV